MKPTEEQIAQAVFVMSTVIPCFPRSNTPEGTIAHELIAREIRSFCATVEQLEWLTDTAIRHMRDWKGIPELRGLFCTKYRAADGVEMQSTMPGFTEEDLEADYKRREAGKIEAQYLEYRRRAEIEGHAPLLLEGEVKAPPKPRSIKTLAEMEKDLEHNKSAPLTQEERERRVRELEIALALTRQETSGSVQ